MEVWKKYALTLYQNILEEKKGFYYFPLKGHCKLCIGKRHCCLRMLTATLLFIYLIFLASPMRQTKHA